jgi:hypothetical protein
MHATFIIPLPERPFLAAACLPVRAQTQRQVCPKAYLVRALLVTYISPFHLYVSFQEKNSLRGVTNITL